jgi:vacuolar-type H+-ATPase subunit C/Vma6
VRAVDRVSEAAARDVASSPEPAVAVRRLTEWRLPDPAAAAALPALWSRYELHRDPVELERDIARATIEGWRRTLRRAGRPAQPVAAFVEQECDHANLLTAMRLRASGEGRGTRLGAELLPVGRLSVRDLAEVAAGRDPATLGIGEALAGVPGSAPDADTLADLERRLTDGRRRAAGRGWVAADPLGAGIPVAFVADLEREAAQVRALVLAAAPAAPAPSGVRRAG